MAPSDLCSPGSNGKDVLWVRSFEFSGSTLTCGHGGSTVSFWSPDSRWIGFLRTVLRSRKIDITGGPPISVASALAAMVAMEPRRRDCVETGATPFAIRYRRGREVVPLTKREKAVTIGRLGPYFLPDGNHYLYEGPNREPDTLFTSAHSIRTQASCWCTVDQVLLINRDTYSTSSDYPHRATSR